MIKNYNLEINTIIKKVNILKAKRVLLQFPDGLKSHADKVLKELKDKTENTIFFIYGGTNFGACDLPQGMEKFEIDLVVNFGHNDFGLNKYIKK